MKYLHLPKTFLATLLTLFLLSPSLLAAESWVTDPTRLEFYSENTYFNDSSHLTSDAFLRAYYDVGADFEFFAGLHFSRDWNSESNFILADSYIAPTVGLTRSLGRFFRFWAEYRLLFRPFKEELNRPDSEGDPRLGFTFFDSREVKQFESSNLKLISYADFFWIPRVSEKDTVINAWSRVWWNTFVPSSSDFLSVGPYIELNLNETPSTELGTNDKALRYGLKVQLKWPRTYLQLMVYDSLALQSGELLEPVRATLVIGGSY